MPHVRTGDISTYYEDRGQGPAVVLLHASCLDHRFWAPQVETLAKDHRVVAYDLRGHGASEGSAHKTYSAELMADDLGHLLDALGLERPVLVGLSLGGMVALTYASRHPARLGGLVLVGTPTPPLLSTAERMHRAVMPRLFIAPVGLIGYERLKNGLVWVQARIHGDDAMGRFQAKDLPAMPTREFVKSVKSFASFHHVEVDLGRLTMPVLVMVGEKEPPLLHHHMARIQAAVPHATTQVLPGAGHASPLDAPEAFEAGVRGFVARVAPARAPAA